MGLSTANMVVSEVGSVEMGIKLRHMVLENLEALRVTFRAADPKGSGVLSMSQFRAALFRVVGMPVNASGVVGSKFHQNNPIATLAENDLASGFDLMHRLLIANYSKFLNHIRAHDEANIGRIPSDFFRDALVSELGVAAKTVDALYARIPADVHGEVRYQAWIEAFVRDAYKGSTMFHSWFLPYGIRMNPVPEPEPLPPLQLIMPPPVPEMQLPLAPQMQYPMPPPVVHLPHLHEFEFLRQQELTNAVRQHSPPPPVVARQSTIRAAAAQSMRDETNAAAQAPEHDAIFRLNYMRQIEAFGVFPEHLPPDMPPPGAPAFGQGVPGFAPGPGGLGMPLVPAHSGFAPG